MWLVFLIKEFWQVNIVSWGILPRQIVGLKGIFSSVFIHADIEHISSNSIPILVLGMLLFLFYRKIAIPVFLWIWFISGLWLWLGGRNHETYQVYHIGASTLVYGMAFFLFFAGVLSKNRGLMVVSALVVFLYGSIMWGLFPLKEEMSWEGHLFGAIAGILVAYGYRKESPKPKKFDWEEDDDNLAEPFDFEQKQEEAQNSKNPLI